jgi:hypothetical protein
MPSTRAATSGRVHSPVWGFGGEDPASVTHADMPVAFNVTRTSPFGQA